MIPLWPRILPIRNAKHRQNPVTVRGHGVPVYCNTLWKFLRVKTWLQTRVKRSILNSVKNTPAESAFGRNPLNACQEELQ